jgi:tetratricopeptide (TPR) repeat protein
MNTSYFFLLLVLIVTSSCDRYPQAILTKKIFPNAANHDEKTVNKNKFNEILKRYKLPAVDNKSYFAGSTKVNRINYTRYFADAFSFSPLIEINNKGVEYALKGMYTEAEILFNEAIKENEKFSFAYNNLAVIYELNNNKDRAFSMYLKACFLEPDNKYYRWNFLYFCDNKTDFSLFR